jgi:hypothetical protein
VVVIGRQRSGFIQRHLDVRNALQAHIEKLTATKAAIKLPKVRKPQWLKPELRVRVRHLAGGDTLRHAIVQALVT